MRDDIQQLLYLQDFDQEISTLTEELNAIPQQKERAKERLANDSAAVEQAKLAFQENEVATKKVELDAGTRRDTISKLKTQQFETKKNDEFTKIGEEITRYESQVDELETTELELMEKADELRAKISAAQDALSKTQALVDEEISTLSARAEEHEAQKEKFLEQRTHAAKEIEEDLLSEYDRLFKMRSGKAVCEVTVEQQCTGCHLKVTPATFITAKTGDSIAECDNCGCMLYYGPRNQDHSY